MGILYLQFIPGYVAHEAPGRPRTRGQNHSGITNFGRVYPGGDWKNKVERLRLPRVCTPVVQLWQCLVRGDSFGNNIN